MLDFDECALTDLKVLKFDSYSEEDLFPYRGSAGETAF